MNSKPRICYVIPSLNVGGTERQVLHLIEGLSPDFEQRVVCTYEPGVWASRARRDAEVVGLGIRSGWDPRGFLRLLREFRSFKPDVVQTFLFGFDYAANVAARRAGVAVVISSRRERATWRRPRHLWLQRRANRLVDAIVVNSHAVAEYAAAQEGEQLDRYTIVYNAVAAGADSEDEKDVRIQLTVPESAPLVGMVANFSPDKDHELFIAMAEAVRQRRPDAHFVLIGDGPRRAAIQRLVVDRGIADAFRFVGSEDEIGRYYRAMDVVVLCSRTEGLPNVLLEAMVRGRPVVAASVGGIPEIVSDRVTGRLIASRTPDDFAEAVLEILEHPGEAEQMGQRAAIYTRDRFSPEVMTRAYRTLYTRLLASTRGKD